MCVLRFHKRGNLAPLAQMSKTSFSGPSPGADCGENKSLGSQCKRPNTVMVFKKKKKKSAKGKCLGETNSDVYWKPTFKYLLNEVCLEDMKEYSVVLSCFRNCYLHSYLPYTCVQVKEGMSYIYFSIFHLNLIQLGV